MPITVVFYIMAVNHIIGRAGASPPSRATGAKILYIYVRPGDTYRNFYFTVTSRACAQSL